MSRRSYGSDYGEFFVERERQHRFRNNTGRPESTTGSRNGSTGRNSTLNFDEDEIYYFGVVQLPLHVVSQILRSYPPPPDYFQLPSMERAVYLYYFTLYRKYITSVDVFHQVFNREFYKYTAAGHSNNEAFAMICQHTKKEHERYLLKRNQEAYNKSQKRLFSDDRESPESRNSERHSGNESDLNSIDSMSKESQINGPLLHRVPHAFMQFAVGGKVVYLNPAKSVTTVCVDDAKNFYLDSFSQRNIDAVETFKGPMLVGKTPPQTALLFIQRQIDRIRRSDVYRGNQQSGDINDCLLIWNLLDILVRQQGKVTGPDLARLLIADYSYSSFTAQNFLRGSVASGRANGRADGVESRNEKHVSLQAMDKFTQFLLGGLAEEALDSAMRDGLLFDALMLANRLYRNDPRKLSEIEMKLLQYRAQQHPVMTLLSVAGGTNVPLLKNTTTEDASGWRAHVAIVLANLHSEAATNTVYQTGLALAQKDFNSAADFCFLAVNLLTGRDCCFSGVGESPNDDTGRKRIKLISASLPDYDTTDSTSFGWSILDYQATEIFEYTQNMAANGQPTALSQSVEFQKCRLQYAKLISTYGGFATHVSLYCSQIACSIWDRLNMFDKSFIAELYELADSHRYIGNTENSDNSWIEILRSYHSQHRLQHAPSQSQAVKPTNVEQHQPTPHVQPMNDVASALNMMNPPLGMSTPRINGSLADVNRAHGHNIGDFYDRSKRVSDAPSIATDGLYNSQLPPDCTTVSGIETLPDNFEALAVVQSVQQVSMNIVEQPVAASPPPPPTNVQAPQQGYYYRGGYSDPSTPVSLDVSSQPQAIDNQMDGLSIGDQIVPPVVHQPTYDAYDQFSSYAGHQHQQSTVDAYGGNNNVLDHSSADLQQPIATSPKETTSEAVKNSGGGLFSGLKKSLIVYDPDRKCYVGNVEQETPPPPTGLPIMPMNCYTPDVTQSPSEPPSFNEAMDGVPAMLPIPIPDGATLSSTAPKRNGRLPQKRYATAGFNN